MFVSSLCSSFRRLVLQFSEHWNQNLCLFNARIESNKLSRFVNIGHITQSPQCLACSAQNILCSLAVFGSLCLVHFLLDALHQNLRQRVQHTDHRRTVKRTYLVEYLIRQHLNVGRLIRQSVLQKLDKLKQVHFVRRAIQQRVQACKGGFPQRQTIIDAMLEWTQIHLANELLVRDRGLKHDGQNVLQVGHHEAAVHSQDAVQRQEGLALHQQIRVRQRLQEGGHHGLRQLVLGRLVERVLDRGGHGRARVHIVVGEQRLNLLENRSVNHSELAEALGDHGAHAFVLARRVGNEQRRDGRRKRQQQLGQGLRGRVVRNDLLQRVEQQVRAIRVLLDHLNQRRHILLHVAHRNIAERKRGRPLDRLRLAVERGKNALLQIGSASRQIATSLAQLTNRQQRHLRVRLVLTVDQLDDVANAIVVVGGHNQHRQTLRNGRVRRARQLGHRRFDQLVLELLEREHFALRAVVKRGEQRFERIQRVSLQQRRLQKLVALWKDLGGRLLEQSALLVDARALLDELGDQGQDERAQVQVRVVDVVGALCHQRTNQFELHLRDGRRLAHNRGQRQRRRHPQRRRRLLEEGRRRLHHFGRHRRRQVNLEGRLRQHRKAFQTRFARDLVRQALRQHLERRRHLVLQQSIAKARQAFRGRLHRRLLHLAFDVLERQLLERHLKQALDDRVKASRLVRLRHVVAHHRRDAQHQQHGARLHAGVRRVHAAQNARRNLSDDGGTVLVAVPLQNEIQHVECARLELHVRVLLNARHNVRDELAKVALDAILGQHIAAHTALRLSHQHQIAQNAEQSILHLGVGSLRLELSANLLHHLGQLLTHQLERRHLPHQRRHIERVVLVAGERRSALLRNNRRQQQFLERGENVQAHRRVVLLEAAQQRLANLDVILLHRRLVRLNERGQHLDRGAAHLPRRVVVAKVVHDDLGSAAILLVRVPPSIVVAPLVAAVVKAVLVAAIRVRHIRVAIAIRGRAIVVVGVVRHQRQTHLHQRLGVLQHLLGALDDHHVERLQAVFAQVDGRLRVVAGHLLVGADGDEQRHHVLQVATHALSGVARENADGLDEGEELLVVKVDVLDHVNHLLHQVVEQLVVDGAYKRAQRGRHLLANLDLCVRQHGLQRLQDVLVVFLHGEAKACCQILHDVETRDEAIEVVALLLLLLLLRVRLGLCLLEALQETAHQLLADGRAKLLWHRRDDILECDGVDVAQLKLAIHEERAKLVDNLLHLLAHKFLHDRAQTFASNRLNVVRRIIQLLQNRVANRCLQ
mmetsp:Transcript_45169/g.74903  ORF Transcript_45169/g.74903 Transcript_45169/m.74903 type:complete len:1267 (+) Transcript_45169:110-3910(+)